MMEAKDKHYCLHCGKELKQIPIAIAEAKRETAKEIFGEMDNIIPIPINQRSDNRFWQQYTKLKKRGLNYENT